MLYMKLMPYGIFCCISNHFLTCVLFNLKILLLPCAIKGKLGLIGKDSRNFEETLYSMPKCNIIFFGFASILRIINVSNFED